MSLPPSLLEEAQELELQDNSRSHEISLELKVGGLNVYFMTRQPAKPASFYLSARKWHDGTRNLRDDPLQKTS